MTMARTFKPMCWPPLADYPADNRFHVTCMAPGCLSLQKLARHWGTTLAHAEAVRAWGEAITLPELKARARCRVCGRKGFAMVEVSSPGPRKDEDGWLQ
jgi:hypothetical protein